MKQLHLTLELNTRCSSCTEILVNARTYLQSKIPAVAAPFQSLSTDDSFGS